MLPERRRPVAWRWVSMKWVFAIVCLVALCATACGLSSATQSSNGKVSIVAAENFWGSIAGQLGGDKVAVTSIISNPDTDPHSYEATPQDARLIATANYVIVN